jgi:hypothetical protein
MVDENGRPLAASQGGRTPILGGTSVDLKGLVGLQRQFANLLLEAGSIRRLTPEQMRACPTPEMNTVAWLIWHIARCEDVTINTVARGVPQVLVAGGWREKAGLADPRIGTGMTHAEVEAFSAAVDLDALCAYRREVVAQTAAWIAEVDEADLDRQFDIRERLSVVEPIVGGNAEWLYDAWTKPVGFFLGYSAIAHVYTHLGEIQAISGLLGVKMR